MFGLIKNHLEKKRKEDREQALKKSLSDKFFNYDEENLPIESNLSDKTDYTEITICGKRMRVRKENITILDISDERLAMGH